MRVWGWGAIFQLASDPRSAAAPLAFALNCRPLPDSRQARGQAGQGRTRHRPPLCHHTRCVATRPGPRVTQEDQARSHLVPGAARLTHAGRRDGALAGAGPPPQSVPPAWSVRASRLCLSDRCAQRPTGKHFRALRIWREGLSPRAEMHLREDAPRTREEEEIGGSEEGVAPRRVCVSGDQ